ncbi:hypothetical protein [Haliscomenobacter sp.]|uniref:hypothetical protein n=1 Tax=Haliscomenobacter sp. TaxID=2717303 RepID=UPI0033652E6A
MIKVNKDFDAIPLYLSTAKVSQQTLDAIAAQDGSLYIKYYKNSSVKDQLLIIYHKKCAYCESTITHSAPLQVEHYRPKAKVDIKDILVGEVHKGYYWLGNEWTNLLLACQSCNGQGAKGNRFPIKGNRILVHPANPDYHSILHPLMLDEEPLLLNPELVDPADHLSLDHYGILHGKSAFGTASIEIYNLNRDGLITRRLKIIQQFVNRINRQLSERFAPTVSNPLTPQQFQRQMELILEDIIEGQLPQTEYSFVYISIALAFDAIILSHIDAAFQGYVKESFQTYIQKIIL